MRVAMIAAIVIVAIANCTSDKGPPLEAAASDVGANCNSCAEGLSCIPVFTDTDSGACETDGAYCTIGCGSDGDCTNELGSGFVCQMNCQGAPHCRNVSGPPL